MSDSSSRLHLLVPVAFVITAIAATVAVRDIADVVGGLRYVALVIVGSATLMAAVAGAMRGSGRQTRLVMIGVLGSIASVMAFSVTLLSPMAYDGGAGRTSWIEATAPGIALGIEAVGIAAMVTGVVVAMSSRAGSTRLAGWLIMSAIALVASGYLTLVLLISYDLKA